MSFKDLAKKESALDKSKTDKTPEKETTGKTQADTPENPEAKA